ncbi:uncharacterized protein LOC127554093 [Antechinus flavipes]|uniref:uncharacterized protein LOC127554093 n=1 Tax=Antechinus flavipes TaxID=38775 RepID=UPI0022358032|nr:uncharacterized protein LOC127554093 [Antechinus flavipes]
MRPRRRKSRAPPHPPPGPPPRLSLPLPPASLSLPSEGTRSRVLSKAANKTSRVSLNPPGSWALLREAGSGALHPPPLGLPLGFMLGAGSPAPSDPAPKSGCSLRSVRWAHSHPSRRENSRERRGSQRTTLGAAALPARAWEEPSPALAPSVPALSRAPPALRPPPPCSPPSPGPTAPSGPQPPPPPASTLPGPQSKVLRAPSCLWDKSQRPLWPLRGLTCPGRLPITPWARSVPTKLAPSDSRLCPGRALPSGAQLWSPGGAFPGLRSSACCAEEGQRGLWGRKDPPLPRSLPAVRINRTGRWTAPRTVYQYHARKRNRFHLDRRRTILKIG